MAKCTRIYKTDPTFKTRIVTLEMTPQEAYALRAILSVVGGDSSNSPRIYIESIIASLNEIGIKFNSNITESLFPNLGQKLNFPKDTLVEFLHLAMEQDNRNCKNDDL